MKAQIQVEAEEFFFPIPPLYQLRAPAEYSKCRNVILNKTCFTVTRNMATGGYHVRPKVTEENFSCPVCLEVLENPISIPCGHT